MQRKEELVELVDELRKAGLDFEVKNLEEVPGDGCKPEGTKRQHSFTNKYKTIQTETIAKVVKLMIQKKKLNDH